MAKQQEALRNRSQDITMQGWLYKGPDVAADSGVMNFSKVAIALSPLNKPNTFR
jgi:hypothetical protein